MVSNGTEVWLFVFRDGQPRVSLAGHLFYPESEPKQLIKSRGVEVSLKAWTKSKKRYKISV